jgi:hypothetical protein
MSIFLDPRHDSRWKTLYMKTLTALFAALVLSSVTPAAFAAVNDQNLSKLSAFSGRYRGTILLNIGGSAATGTTQGRFSASQTKERGTLALNSVVNAGGPLIVWNESYNFRKRAFTYLLNAAGTAASGGGTARIKTSSINYNGTFVTGSTTYTLAGTMRRSKRNLRISETFFGSGTTFVITYNLKRRGN